MMERRRPGDKPLSEPMMVVYWCIYASLSLSELNKECDYSPYANLSEIMLVP